MALFKPDAPDPQETAAAQTGTNIATATANAYLGNVNQKTPYGTIKYKQTGTKKVKDPTTGKTSKVPTFKVVTKLSPNQKKIQRAGEGAQISLAETANERADFLKDYLPNNEIDTTAVENWLYDLGTQRLDPRFERGRNDLSTRLANQGIAPGTEAYRREMDLYGQQENDAYNELALRGRGQAFNELVARRNQPINEITALLSGSQVSQPTAAPTNMPQIPTVDYAGLVQDNYNQRMQQSNQLLGGLFGLGAAGIKAF